MVSWSTVARRRKIKWSSAIRVYPFTAWRLTEPRSNAIRQVRMILRSPQSMFPYLLSLTSQSFPSATGLLFNNELQSFHHSTGCYLGRHTRMDSVQLDSISGLVWNVCTWWQRRPTTELESNFSKSQRIGGSRRNTRPSLSTVKRFISTDFTCQGKHLTSDVITWYWVA